jgi:hypothetical protein
VRNGALVVKHGALVDAVQIYRALGARHRRVLVVEKADVVQVRDTADDDGVAGDR